MARVLIIDDERALCESLSKVLRAKGHETDFALSGETGIEKVRVFRPHVVLLDIRMPGVNGLEVLARMKSLDPAVRVIMVTAAHAEEVAKMALREGASDYITKPLDPERLNLMINLLELDVAE